MSSNQDIANNSTAGSAAQGQAQTQGQGQGQGQGLTVQQKQLLELSARFKHLVSEAKKLGENSQKGKEMLIQAAKIKAVYDNYTKHRQQAAAAAATAASGGSNPNAPIVQQQNTGSGSTTATTTSSSGNSSGNAGNQLATLLRDALTPEETAQYEKLLSNFKNRASAVRDKRTFIKTNIDKLTAEINKQKDIATKGQLAEKRNELIANLKALSEELNGLYIQLQAGKKSFYVECAKHNPRLHQILQKSTQLIQQQKQQRQQQQQQQQQQVSNAGTPIPGAGPVAQTPGGANGRPAVKQETMNANNNNSNMPTSAGQQSPQNSGNMNRSSSQMTSSSSPSAQQKGQQAQGSGTNAAVATNPGGNNKSTIFKPTDPSVPVSENVNTKTPDAVSVRSNRPTITGGSGMNAPSLNTPAVAKLPPYEIDTERVMSKRKLRELVKVVGVDEGDGETVIDGDVEELLLDLADDFITNVTAFACRLAKHRKSDNLESKDIQLHLEKNWNIRIPGYSSDEIRSTRKWNPSHAYNQKLQNINADKNGSTKHSGSGHKK